MRQGRPAGHGEGGLALEHRHVEAGHAIGQFVETARLHPILMGDGQRIVDEQHVEPRQRAPGTTDEIEGPSLASLAKAATVQRLRSEEHTYELQSLIRTSYALFS